MRAVVVDAPGTTTAVGRAPWQMFTPEDGSAFARELDAGGVAASLHSLIDAAAAGRERIAGIAVTGQREGVVFLDAAGAPLLVSPNIDARASAEGMAIDATHGERVYAVTGHLPSLLQAPAKLAWLRAVRAEAAGRVAHVLPLADWIAMLLTGEPVASRSLACELGLLDVRSRDVPTALLDALGMSAGSVPRVSRDGDAAGAVRGGAFAGAPVALAGGDTQCALAGMGAVAGGAGVAAGWSAPVQLVVETPVLDARSRTWTGVHVALERWVLESNAGECGRVWDWICGLMGLGAGDADAIAASSPPGSRDAMAVLGPRVMRASLMSAGIGAITVGMPLVMSSPERGDVLRSVLESIAFAVRANVEQLEDVGGARIPRLALGGGMSRSMLFARILADVLDRPIDVARSAETSALGAAIVASPALGLHATIIGAAAIMAPPMACVEPEPRAASVYEDCYGRWCDLAERLEALE